MGKRGATPRRNFLASWAAAAKRGLGERVYLQILERFNVKDPGEFRKSEDAVKCYEMLTEIARQEVG